MLTSNLYLGIWKWIEGYLDLGTLKNKNEDPRYFYGTGIRLNLLPSPISIGADSIYDVIAEPSSSKPNSWLYKYKIN